MFVAVLLSTGYNLPQDIKHKSYDSMDKLKVLLKMFMMQLTTESIIHLITEQNITERTQREMHVDKYTFYLFF